MTPDPSILRGPGRDFSPGEATRRRNPQLWPVPPSDDTGKRSEQLKSTTGEGIRPLGQVSKRIRQRSKALMNKLETEFYQTIRGKYPNYPPVRVQAKTYRLANGLRYTPDFTATSWPQGTGPAIETAWEVKGKWVDGDSFPKLKMAAAVWPEVRWLLAWKNAAGQWRQQDILP